MRYQKIHRSPEQLLAQLKSCSLDLKLTVGIWYFAPGGGRFHERYVPEMSIPERLELAAEMARCGVKSIEALKLVKEAGATPMGLWPGNDGFLYPLGTIYYEQWDWHEGTLAECLDEVPGVRIGLESKPCEPVPNNIYRTTGDGLVMAADVESRLSNPVNRGLLEKGHCIVGFQPEVGHILMCYEVLPYAFMRIARQGRLFHIHMNSQLLGNYDQDLNVGVVSWQDTEALMYSLKAIGYGEYFGIDINPEHMPVLEAVKINARVLQIMNERIDSLPHEKLLECFYSPEKNRGGIEMILAESFAPRKR